MSISNRLHLKYGIVPELGLKFFDLKKKLKPFKTELLKIKDSSSIDHLILFTCKGGIPSISLASE